MTYLASDLFSGTWKNIIGPTASWQSDQKSTYRGFTVFVDGYGDENNGASIAYEGSNYYEWGYSFLDSDLDGKLEISEIHRGVIGDENGFTFVSDGYDELVGRYFSSTHSNDRISDGGTWDRNPESYSGSFKGSDLGIFEIDVKLEFTSTANNDLIMGSTNNDLISGDGGDDFLMSRSGNDTLEGGLGNDTIDGGYGNDIAVFNYNYSDYTIVQSNNLKAIENSPLFFSSTDSSNSLTFTITNTTEGRDSLTSVELVQFADKTIGIDYSNPIDGYNYLLDNIKDYDGNAHANTGSVSDATKTSYKYQGLIDVNADGKLEDIYTNKESGRWVTVSRNSNTNQVDWNDHGKGGTTRVVGIYIDPLVKDGIVEQGSDHDSQRRFQNDLNIDNLTVKASGDYDGDGFQEVYWKTNDGTAYLRALMHADGNIQYANYQSKEQMSEYLTSKGFADAINDIIG